LLLLSVETKKEISSTPQGVAYGNHYTIPVLGEHSGTKTPPGRLPIRRHQDVGFELGTDEKGFAANSMKMVMIRNYVRHRLKKAGSPKITT